VTWRERRAEYRSDAAPAVIYLIPETNLRDLQSAAPNITVTPHLPLLLIPETNSVKRKSWL